MNRDDPSNSRSLRDSYAGDLKRIIGNYVKEVNMVLQYNVKEATSVEIVITDFAVDRSYSSEKLMRGLNTKVSLADRMVISRAIQYQATHGVVQALNQMKVPKGSRGSTGQYINKGTMLELAHVNVTLIKSVQQRYLDNVALLLARFLGGGTLSWDKLVKGIKYLGAISKAQAEQIARTEVIRTISIAEKEAFLNSGKKEWRWVTQNDERVCKFCGSIDGKVVEIGKPFISFRGQPITNSPVHPNCYDKDTMILTKRGFLTFPDIVDSDMVFSLDPNTNIPEWVKIKKKIEYPYIGKMVSFKSKKTVDILVTPDHDVYVGKRDDKNDRSLVEFGFEKAKGIKTERHIQCSSEWIGVNPSFLSLDGKNSGFISINGIEIKVDLFFEFMGYYLSEGSTTKRTEKSYMIKITQSKTNNYEKIWNCANSMNIGAYRAIDYIGMNGKPLGEYLVRFGKARVKYIPDIIKNAPKDLLNIFLDAYILGDGSVRNEVSCFRGVTWIDKSRVITTSSKKMMSDLVEVLFKAGFSASVRYQHPKVCTFRNGTFNCCGMFIVSVLTSSQRALPKAELVDYDDFVYCVDLEKNHVMLTMRNGKICWNGNCRCFQEVVR